MRTSRNNLTCGVLFACVGLAFVIHAWRTLPAGQASAMGPGYFPILLGLLLIALGAVISLGRGGQDEEPAALPPIAWRGVLLIAGAALVFGLTVRGLGMAPSLLIATFLAALSTGQMTPSRALLFSAVLTSVNTALFVFALGLPYPVIGPWLGGQG
jgi:hypothetical protein